MKAMILAAGRGQRMRPLTAETPKPLLSVGGRPLIERHLRALAAAGFRDVVINLHHLGEQIQTFVGDGAAFGLSVSYSMELELLETAGGIRKALPLLGDDPFAVIAGDILTDFDFAQLPTELGHRLGHLVMVENPDHHVGGDFSLDDEGELRLAATGQTLTFSGIAVYSPALFASLDEGVPAKLRLLYDQVIPRGLMSGECFCGEWSDVGTPERLSELDARIQQ